MAGYPIVSVPAGYTFGRPVGISFLGRASSEPTLIKLAYAFEQATQIRQAPRFIPAHGGEPTVDLPAIIAAGLPAAVAGTPAADGRAGSPVAGAATPTLEATW
jgi:hypothetical protein